MTDDTANLVLEHLRAIRADVREIKATMIEHGHILTRMEIGVEALRTTSRENALRIRPRREVVD